MNQRTLFPEFDRQQLDPADLAPTDPNVEPGDKPRLTGQNAAILDRLKEGPATNAELSLIALKYTGRISDLRKHGYEIKCERLEGGTTRYTLNGVG